LSDTTHQNAGGNPDQRINFSCGPNSDSIKLGLAQMGRSIWMVKMQRPFGKWLTVKNVNSRRETGCNLVPCCGPEIDFSCPFPFHLTDTDDDDYNCTADGH
jgi:hypothetical protein